MTDEVTPPPGPDEDSSFSARNLREFLQSKQPPRSFLSSLAEQEASLPQEDEVAQLIEEVRKDERQAAKLSELIRIGVGEETAGRTRKALTALGGEFIRAQDKALANWSLIASTSPETDLGLLARHVRKVRATKDKQLIGQAELVLLTGIAIISARPAFDIVGALTTLSRQLFAEPLENHVADKAVKKAVRKGSLRSLETFAAVSTTHTGALDDCRKRTAKIASELEVNNQQLRECRDARVIAEGAIKELQEENVALRLQIEQLSGRIAGVKGGAADDITRLKARVRQFYLLKILDALSTADEALGLDPPSFRVARERVSDVISDVRKEVEWLDRS